MGDILSGDLELRSLRKRLPSKCPEFSHLKGRPVGCPGETTSV